MRDSKILLKILWVVLFTIKTKRKKNNANIKNKPCGFAVRFITFAVQIDFYPEIIVRKE